MSPRSAHLAALITVSGPDRPGIAASLFTSIARLGLFLEDAGQVQIHGRLLLSVEVSGPSVDVGETLRTVSAALGPCDRPDDRLAVSVTALDAGSTEHTTRSRVRHLVTILAPELHPTAMAAVCGRITACGGNIERVVRLASYPVVSYELVVTGAEHALLGRELSYEAARTGVDLAVQSDGLHRRAKHLVVLDADSTLFRGEVVDMLAEHAGCAEEVAAVTQAAMTGSMDFEQSLRQRVAMFAGVDAGILGQIVDSVELAPGARTLVRTLTRLGYAVAVVSGGFEQVVEPIAAGIGIDQVAANSLEIVDGVLTGRLLGPVVDRAGKAAALIRFAQMNNVPLTQTIAVGDGANDVDMLTTAGLGIAFNAKPVVRDAADTALNVPNLDAILFLLGISRAEIEAADGTEAAV